jgi:hypothetical protein
MTDERMALVELLQKSGDGGGNNQLRVKWFVYGMDRCIAGRRYPA